MGAVIVMDREDSDRIEAALLARAAVLDAADLRGEGPAYRRLAGFVRSSYDAQQLPPQRGPPDRSKDQHGRFRMFCMTHKVWCDGDCTRACPRVSIPVCEDCEGKPQICDACRERF